MDAPTAFALLAAAHLGFQAVVTLVVYPALADVPEDAWAPAHDRHSRRIAVVVAPLYPALLAAAVWLAVTTPLAPGVALALAGTALALGATAFGAAPTHARLGRGRTPALVRRLLVIDRVRLAGAVLAMAGALLLRDPSLQ